MDFALFLLLVAVLLVVPFLLNARRKEDVEVLERQLRRASDRISHLELQLKEGRAQQAEPKPAAPDTSTPVPEPVAVREVSAPLPPPPMPPKMAPPPAPAPPKPVVTAPPAPVRHEPPLIRPAPPARAAREDLETRFGTQWLSRIGAGILVLGVALFLGYAFTELGAWGKIGLAYGTAGAMMAGGLMLEKRKELQTYGRVLLAAGWALTYFTTYALQHVSAVRVVESEIVDLLLLFVVAAGMIGHSLRYRSEPAVGFAYLLAYATVAISHVTLYSLSALAVLSVSMGFILWKQNWFVVEVVGIIGAYLCHLSWVTPILQASGRLPRTEFFTSAAWLAAYWLTFNLVHLARRPANIIQYRLSYAALLVNAFLFLGLMRYQSHRSGLAFWALTVAGIIYLLFASAAQRMARRASFVLFATLGIALIFAAVPLRFTGARLAGLWLVEAEILLLAGFLLRDIHFRRLAWLASGITGGYLAVHDWLLPISAGGPQPEASAVLFGLAAALAYVNAYAMSRLFQRVLQDRESLEPLAHRAFSWMGWLFLTLLLWRTVDQHWLAPAWALAMVALTEASGWGGLLDLRRQAKLLSGITIFWCFSVNLLDLPELRWLTVGLSALACYYVHARSRQLEDRPLPYLSYAATALVATLLGKEISNIYLALAFLAMTLALAEFGAWMRDLSFRVSSYGMLLPAAYCLFWFNLGSASPHRLPLAAGFVAGLLWLTFRIRAWVQEGRARPQETLVSTACIYLSAGSAAWLVWLEASRWWAAPVIALLALAFAAPGLMMNLRHFRYAAWILHLVAVEIALVVNLPEPGRTQWLTERAWSVLALATVTYLLSYWMDRWRRSSGKDEPDRRWGAVQCWIGTGFLALLAWYDMRPVAVAVAWGFLGVAFPELGAMFSRRSMRWQGYLLSVSAFARIFFSNLDASTPVMGVSTRFWTVGLLATFFYYQFLRLRADRRLLSSLEVHMPEVYSYLGLASIAALLRFELTRPWVAVAWAILGATVLAIGLYRSDPQFRLQAYILVGMVAFRTSLNNFYLLETYAGWSARLVTVSAVVAVLFGCFFLTVVAGAKAANAIDRYSRYLYFFVPVALLTVLLAREVSAGLLTLAWGLEGLALFLCGLGIGERPFRLTGMVLLLVCIGRIFFFDLRSSNMLYRIASFLVLGAVLLIVSFLYTRYRKKVGRYL